MKNKKQLKKLAHALKPIVLIGQAGLSANVQQEIEKSLHTHELLKIKLPQMPPAERKILAQTICQQQNAELIQAIGRTITIFKAREE